ncbi:MAG: hypothetical protein ACHQRK_07325 [Gemmatimonadales bacterium]|jgi:hypothetical protein
MFDAHYFQKTLPHDVKATGGSPVVEVVLTNGHTHRVRSVLDVADGHLTIEAYLVRADLAHHRPRFGGTEGEPHEVIRVVVAYEAIASVVLDPSAEQMRVRTGFASG